MLFVLVLVAVAVTTWPAATTCDAVKVNDAVPELSIVTVRVPRRTYPSALPPGSAAGSE